MMANDVIFGLFFKVNFKVGLVTLMMYVHTCINNGVLRHKIIDGFE